MASDLPTVSVLMTVHNGAPYLRAAVDSIVAQTFENWELIVLENGSTDQSAEILATYSDRRVRVLSAGYNMGRTPALRHAFDNAKGRYIAVLDADDISAPSRFAQQVTHLDNHPAVVLVGTWARLIDADGRTLPGREWTPPIDGQRLHERLAWANPIIHSSSMYRRDLASEVGGYPAELTHSQDAGLWLRLAVRGEVAMIPEHLCEYRVLESGLTQARHNRTVVVSEGLAILRSAKRVLTLTADASRRNREEIFIAEIKYGVALIREQAVLSGVSRVIAAIMKRPTALLRNRLVREPLMAAARTIRLGERFGRSRDPENIREREDMN